MKRRFLLPIAVSAVLSTAIAPANVFAIDAAATLDALQPEIVEWRRDIHQYPELGNHEVRTAQRVRPSLETAVGADNVAEMPLVTVAEDFSQYATAAPTFFFFVGSTSAGINPATALINHSPQFLLDEQSLQVGSRAMLQVALDYLHGQAN